MTTTTTTTTTPPRIEGSLGHGHLALFRYSHGDCAVTPIKHVSNRLRVCANACTDVCATMALPCVCVCVPITHRTLPRVVAHDANGVLVRSCFHFSQFHYFPPRNVRREKKKNSLPQSRDLVSCVLAQFSLFVSATASWLAGWLPPCSTTRYNTTTSSVMPARPRSGYPHPSPSPRRASPPDFAFSDWFDGGQIPKASSAPRKAEPSDIVAIGACSLTVLSTLIFSRSLSLSLSSSLVATYRTQSFTHTRVPLVSIRTRVYSPYHISQYNVTRIV